MVTLDHRVVFSARDGVAGREPWVSDGTAAGTFRLGDLAPGTTGSSPELMVVSGGTVFFRAFTPATGWELWKTDGTVAGTMLVEDIVPGPESSEPGDLVAFGGGILFRACDPGAGCELWESDGTSLGTQRVTEIVPGAVGGLPEELMVVGAQVVFRATTPANGTEPWVTDGTAGGTAPLGDLAPGAASSYPHDLKSAGNRGYFIADNGTSGWEIWTTDGTPGGTLLPRDVAPGAEDAVFPHTEIYSTIHGEELYFRAVDDGYATADDLWRTDGTLAGTVKVREMDDFGVWGATIWAGSAGGLVHFGFADFFSPVFGWEPMRTDGTPGGTIRLADLVPGTGGSQPCCWVGGGNLAFFRALIPGGSGLFQTTGQPNETTQLTVAGSPSFFPSMVSPWFAPAETEELLFLGGYDSSAGLGTELYAYGIPILVTSFESGDLSGWSAVVGGP